MSVLSDFVHFRRTDSGVAYVVNWSIESDITKVSSVHSESVFLLNKQTIIDNAHT